MEAHVKQETIDAFLLARQQQRRAQNQQQQPTSVIDLSSSSDSSDSDDDGEYAAASMVKKKKRRRRRVGDVASSGGGVVLPAGFLDPIVSTPPLALPVPAERNGSGGGGVAAGTCKQFWKAGDYVGAPVGDWDSHTGGMDHVRVHPKFLHSNATSHKWALGAFAELLDNALDEVCHGATFVNLDMILNKKDGSQMLAIEDNGGGMDPDKMRQCMSLGYSEKSKLANTIGQYGNGFKTSTMRLGADVIVFSRCSGKNRKGPTQSIGLLSYTFLRSTGKEDIVVPTLDYERKGDKWSKVMRSSTADWNHNLETIVQWSPYSSETNLLQQFNLMQQHGTRVIIYNLWEDDQGLLELDFDSDPFDIQIRGVNREEKDIEMAQKYPNSRHFLTYRHSLRSYVSILYLRLPPTFRIILRGKDIEHHNIVNDMMMSTKITYRPQSGAENTQDRDPNLVAVVTIGFVKDAGHHIDVQGFNPFWRVWNAAGSDGRGVIGVLEANFVEPAHDKQGFERTTVLARLENKLLQLQKTYWTSNCHLIGYAPRRNKKEISNAMENLTDESSDYGFKANASSRAKRNNGGSHLYKGETRTRAFNKFRGRSGLEEPSSPSPSDHSDGNVGLEASERVVHENSSERSKTACQYSTPSTAPLPQDGVSGGGTSVSLVDQRLLEQLKEENRQLKERLTELEGFRNLQLELQHERDKCKKLELELEESQRKIEILSKHQDFLIDETLKERETCNSENDNLRKKLEVSYPSCYVFAAVCEFSMQCLEIVR
ncbi:MICRORCHIDIA 4-like protein [Drosera capensis]